MDRPLPPRSRVFREDDPLPTPPRPRLRWRIARWALILLAMLAALTALGTFRPAHATTLREAAAARRAGAATTAPAAPASTAASAASPAPAGAAAAAAAAAASATCRAVQPFLWEIGSADAVLASGTAGSGAPTRTTTLGIASASKMLYGAYVAETQPTLTADDRRLLNMTAGFASFEKCTPTQTVADCAASGNDNIVQSAVGRFAYSGGDMQYHAAHGPLARMSARQLGAEMTRVLGVPVAFRQPLIAGGAQISPAGYATVLQRAMRGELKLGAMLGADPVCTDKRACPAAAVSSPAKANWGYGMAHWIEAPEGDGAYSSAGAFGFYPWISHDKRLYGLVAPAGSRPTIYWQSTQCGAAIRQAFVAAGGAPR